MKNGPKAMWPAVVLVLGILGSTGLIVARPEAKPAPREVPAVSVEVREVDALVLNLKVRSQGTVAPRMETDLVVESPGRIVWVAPALDAGAFFEEGEVLARIEARDYENALERARANVERARSRAALQRSSFDRVTALRDRGASSIANVDRAKSDATMAEAELRDAQAARKQAELDLMRTEVRAPFPGRVRERLGQVGQYVARGISIARVYSTEDAEVRLPITSSDVGFLDLASLGLEGAAPVLVRLHGRAAGAEQVWEARLVRSEGALDPTTRMLHVIARIDDPYARGEGTSAPVLPVGTFVSAEITGRPAEGVTRLPRGALREADQVALVDERSRLRLREVRVLRSDGNEVIVDGGLEPGERVVTSPLDAVVEGMAVEVVKTPPADPRS